jgi:hypothetical protein
MGLGKRLQPAMMGLWTNEPLIKRSEVLGWDRCGSCVTKAVKSDQSDFTPLSGTKVGSRLASGRGSLWPDQGHGFGIAPLVADRRDFSGLWTARWTPGGPCRAQGVGLR